MRRFGWIGETRRQRLAEAVQDRIRQWMQRWGAAQDIDAPVITMLEEAPDTEGRERFIARHESACAHTVWDRATWRRLACLWMDVPADAAGEPFARELSRKAVEDLASCIFGRDAHAPDAFEEASGEDSAEADAPAWGGVWMRVAFERQVLDMHLNRAAVDTLVPVLAANAREWPLVPRNACLDATGLPLQIVLPVGEAALREVVDLSVGDVLLTERKLDAAVDVRIDGGEAVGKARLGARQGRFAVVLGEDKAEGLEKQ
ncbi:hypothetical protein GCM10027285_26900 [Oleiagrimonas citrea]|uniref:FliM/FliN family flagellar motor switch protein n=1 Tax=Oleiagrimonas citrea TaxID=1665687 RepID=A0A846ZNA0_9GAMM|nr:FliM/FliN family flagellar motor C-terminal domain-containing protein [Oleiagrimonas citrea]NKZ39030.1 FliM/FliN family flagellar motor switch protein [Oleiagrimonas citrea]